MNTKVVQNQKDRCLGVGHQPLKKRTKFSGAYCPIYHHKTHVSTSCYCGNHRHSEMLSGRSYGWGVPLLAPRCATVMTGRNICFITEVNRCSGLSGRFLNVGIFRGKPMFDSLGVLLNCPMKRLLRRKSHAAKNTAHCCLAHSDTILAIEGLAEHFGSPKSKGKEQLPRILFYGSEQPFHLGRRKSWRAPEEFLGAKSIKSTLVVGSKPFIDATTGHPDRFDNNFGTFPCKNRLHSTNSKLLKSFVTDFSPIELCHTKSIHEKPLCRHTYETVSNQQKPTGSAQLSTPSRDICKVNRRRQHHLFNHPLFAGSRKKRKNGQAESGGSGYV